MMLCVHISLGVGGQQRKTYIINQLIGLKMVRLQNGWQPAINSASLMLGPRCFDFFMRS